MFIEILHEMQTFCTNVVWLFGKVCWTLSVLFGAFFIDFQKLIISSSLSGAEQLLISHNKCFFYYLEQENFALEDFPSLRQRTRKLMQQ